MFPNITVSEETKKYVESMEYCFRGCKNLEMINFYNIQTDNLKNMKGMFCDCNNLIYIDLSSFSTQNVTNMNHMYNGCIN